MSSNAADVIATSTSRLAVSGLSVGVVRSGIPVVADVTLTLEAGEVMALVGESGSGKSTTGLAMLGWTRAGLEITGGTVLIDGRDVLAMTSSELRSARGRLISYVPQDPTSGLNPAIRVGDQLREALQNHRGALDIESVDKRVLEMLEEVGLPSDDRRILRSFPHQLSGGQQQRVAIAIAFACRPRVVVLDEPTTGLDVTTQRRVLETVRSLAGTYGSSAVYVSHDLAVVANIADTTSVMYAGRIIESGTTVVLFDTPSHHYTRGLLAAVPDVDRPLRLVGIDGRPPRPGAWPAGCSFADRCPARRDDCRNSLPSLTSVDPKHAVRCFHPAEDRYQRMELSLASVSSRRPVLLAVRGLDASFGDNPVLRGVDLSVPRGDCTAIVGESGSGKTTLARCIVGLNGRWSGTITFGDLPMQHAGRERTGDQRRRIQYVFQNPYASLNPRMTVAENIDEPLRHFGGASQADRAAEISGALQAVALSDSYCERMPDQLSGGERQRVAIARALVVNPDLLVCDEVTSALDVSVQAQVIERLRSLQEDRGLSMLFITHNLAVVRSIAQHVVVVSRGRVVESGLTNDVLDNPQHAYTKRLLEDLPRIGAGSPPD